MKQLLNDLGDGELSYWEALDELNPIGRWKADFQQAQLCSTIANWSGYAEESLTPKDYIWEETPEEVKPPTQQELQDKIKRAFGVIQKKEKKVK